MSVSEGQALLNIRGRSGQESVRDDLDAIAQLPDVAVEGRGASRTYRLLPDHSLQRVGIADTVALRFGRDVLGFLHGSLLHDVYDRVTQGEPANHGPSAASLARKFVYLQEPARDYSSHQEVLETVIDAVTRSRRLSITYGKPESPRIWAAAEPLSFVIYRRSIYLMVRVEERGTVLRLAVDRILEARGGDAFPYPPDWDPSAELAKGFGIYSDSEPDDVHLRFSAARAHLALSRQLHVTERKALRRDGSVDVYLRCGGPELVRFALEWGPHCEVIGPPELRRRVVAELHETLANYQEAT